MAGLASGGLHRGGVWDIFVKCLFDYEEFGKAWEEYTPA